MIKSKLYNSTDNKFQLPLYVDQQHRVIPQDATNIPMISWPNGTWCLEANVYILELYNKGLSRRNRGGTLLTYATNISHLLRYAFYNRISLINLTDNHFCQFIKMLQAEKRKRQPELFARDSNSVIAIGRNCLEFLACVGRLYQLENFIGRNGQIKAEEKEFYIKQVSSNHFTGKGKPTRKYWTHGAFPTPDPQKKRLPIGTEAIDKIRKVILPTSSSIFLRKRRYLMLKLLEITGGRRSEVADLTCESVRIAASMPKPLLNLITIKKGSGTVAHRMIPIASHDAKFLLEFIEKNRRSVIRATCGFKEDDGYVLISERTGKQLRSNTITQEISILSKAAGIVEKCCPHMFRHRFITKLFVALIEQHEFDNPNSFRRALLEVESIKQIVQQFTGHSNLASLDVYINLAFEEVTNFKNTLNVVNTKRIVKSFQNTLKQLSGELNSGASPTEILVQIQKYLDAFEDDLNTCHITEAT